MAFIEPPPIWKFQTHPTVGIDGRSNVIGAIFGLQSRSRDILPISPTDKNLKIALMLLKMNQVTHYTLVSSIGFAQRAVERGGGCCGFTSGLRLGHQL